VNLNAPSWDSTFVEKKELDESFIDLLLWHIVLRAPKLTVLNYDVVSTNIHGCMTVDLHEQQQDAP
jgi:hypothetical protein